MPSEPRRGAVPGSERELLPGARAVGAPDPAEVVDVTVVLRPRGGDAPDPAELGALAPHARGHLDRDTVEQARGADPDDVRRVEEFAGVHGLEVVGSDPARRSVVLRGSVAALSAAFGVELANYEVGDSSFRGRTGPVTVPADLLPAVEGVFGLDDRPQAQPHFRRHAGGAAATTSGAFTPPQLAALYGFPQGLDGGGETIGIIELGGGYRDADLSAYFAGLGISVPRVITVAVDNVQNTPTGSPAGPDGEVALDIEVAGAVAPGATIAVYFAPNTERGFLDAVTSAVHDRANRPSVISISWGGPEPTWTVQARRVLDAAFADAATLGVTVCCASGDGGSSDGMLDGRAHVDFPASSPHVLACGGTRVVASAGRISSETVWNDGAGGGATGGGVSEAFPLPAWQASAGVPPSVNDGRTGRGVPDVAADADPATGYRVLVDGTATVVGGTSAVAPLYAALIALANQRLGTPAGFLNPFLYAHAPGVAFRDITEGSNGDYAAGPGWDACTGLGSPQGDALVRLLGGTG